MTIFTLWVEGDPLPIVAGIFGLVFGLAADRLAARWPAHEDGAIRRIDWRTPVVVGLSGAAFAGTALRFGANPVHLAVVGLFVAALIVLFATDIDQRLLPNLITYPLVVFAVGAYVLGVGPFVRNVEELAWAAAGAVLVPAALYLLAIPFGEGAIGEGDLKMLVGVGLFIGSLNLFYGLVGGAVMAGVAVALLLFVRRISMKSFVPYGPFLIAGTLWAILALPQT